MDVDGNLMANGYTTIEDYHHTIVVDDDPPWLIVSSMIILRFMVADHPFEFADQSFSE